MNIHEVLVDEMQEGQKIKELWQKVILPKEQTSTWKNEACAIHGAARNLSLRKSLMSPSKQSCKKADKCNQKLRHWLSLQPHGRMRTY